jgi:hypothetical protein
LDGWSRQRWRIVGVVGVGLLLLALQPLIDRFLFSDGEPEPRAAEARLRQFVDGRRAAGEPTTFAELNPPEPPDADNAAVEIDAALSAVYEQFGPEKSWPDVGPWAKTASESFEDESPEHVAAQRAFGKQFGPFCDRVAAALDRPRLRFRLVLVPEGVPDGRATRTLQAVARIVASEAMVADDPLRRVEAARSLLRMARRNEPFSTMDSIVGAVMAERAATAIRIGLERSEVDPAAARTGLDRFLQGDWTAAGARVFQAEIVAVISLYETALAGRVDEKKWDRSVGERWRPADAAMVIDGCKMLKQASRLPIAPFAAYRRSLKTLVDRAKADGNPIALEGLAIDGWVVVERLGRLEAQTRLARIALAAAEYRAKHGDFPASLDELAPMFADGVPLDPYTDAPFVYERTATGVRIASAGRVADEPAVDVETLREKCLVWELKR